MESYPTPQREILCSRDSAGDARMAVALDTHGVYTTKAGVARYIRGLQKGLEEAAPPDLVLEAIAWPVENFEYKQPQRALKTLYREVIWAKISAPRLLKTLDADL